MEIIKEIKEAIWDLEQDILEGTYKAEEISTFFIKGVSCYCPRKSPPTLSTLEVLCNYCDVDSGFAMRFYKKYFYNKEPFYSFDKDWRVMFKRFILGDICADHSTIEELRERSLMCLKIKFHLENKR